MTSLWMERLARPGGAIAVVDGARIVSYRSLLERVSRLARSLTRDEGLSARRVARVALVADASVASIERILALLSLDLGVVLLHPRSTEFEQERALERARVRAVMLRDGTIRWRSSASTCEPEDGPRGPHCVVFTSGTTGVPRPAVLSQAAMVASAEASEANLGWLEGDRWLLSLPVAHVGGLAIVLRCVLGGRTVVVPGATSNLGSGSSLYEQLRLRDITLLSLVPTLLRRLLFVDDPGRSAPPSLRQIPPHVLSLSPTLCSPPSSASATSENLRSSRPSASARAEPPGSFRPSGGASPPRVRACPPRLRAILVGGAPLPEDLLVAAASAGWPVLATYGLTEASSQVTVQPYGTAWRPAIGSGFAVAGAQVRILDGRIQVRGSLLFSGYLGELSPLLEGGWFDTGDVGEILPDGTLHVHARRTDLIVTGGENVYPAEVEAAIEAVSEVERAVVFAVPDVEWGASVAAGIAFRGEPDLKVVLEHLEARLAPFKRPKRIAVVGVDELPLTTSGKVDRRALAERLAARLRPVKGCGRSPS